MDVHAGYVQSCDELFMVFVQCNRTLDINPELTQRLTKFKTLNDFRTAVRL